MLTVRQMCKRSTGALSNYVTIKWVDTPLMEFFLFSFFLRKKVEKIWPEPFSTQKSPNQPTIMCFDCVWHMCFPSLIILNMYFMCLFWYRVAFGIGRIQMWCCLRVTVSTEWSTMANTCTPFVQMTSVPYTSRTTFLSKCIMDWCVNIFASIAKRMAVTEPISSPHFSKYFILICFFFLCSQFDLDTMHPIVKNAIYAEPTSTFAESKRKVQWLSLFRFIFCLVQ